MLSRWRWCHLTVRHHISPSSPPMQTPQLNTRSPLVEAPNNIITTLYGLPTHTITMATSSIIDFSKPSTEFCIAPFALCEARGCCLCGGLGLVPHPVVMSLAFIRTAALVDSACRLGIIDTVSKPKSDFQVPSWSFKFPPSALSSPFQILLLAPFFVSPQRQCS